jgi:hypothetical protein
MNKKPNRVLVKSSVVMTFFGYTNRSSFWEFVTTKGVPHIRLTARRIMFDPVALNHWLAKRDSSPTPRQFDFGPVGGG